MFATDEAAVTKALYTNLLNRDATEVEVAQGVELASIDPRWEYTLTSKLSKARDAIILVPIVALLLS